MRIYSDLVEWYPLISFAEDYVDEAAHLVRIAEAVHGGEATSLLELGAGAGHMASHLKARFDCTLTDMSPEMLGLSHSLNPECTHVVGDMRSLNLKRTFDAVLAHDAIGYMTTTGDLKAAMETAAHHLDPGGVAIFIPDFVKDTFEPTTQCGGRDMPDDRGLRYLEWSYDPDPNDMMISVEFALMIREGGSVVRVEHDRHQEGLFDRATWHRLMIGAGLEPIEIDVQDPYQDDHEVFVARRSA